MAFYRTPSVRFQTTARTFATLLLTLPAGTMSANRVDTLPGDTPMASVAARLGYVDHVVVANDVRLHYVTTGQGEPVVLIPGWPQSWYAWRNVMKQLAAAGREVYALDPRGFGDSDKPSGGYDLSTAAEDVHSFLHAVGLTRPGGVDIVSHDVGTWIAFAHATVHPEDVRRVVLSEASIPGTVAIASIPGDAQNVKSWHFAFNRLTDLPETLVQGHERAYLTWLFNNKAVRVSAIDPVAVDEYVREFSSPGTARAGFEYYRQAFNETNLKQMKEWTTRKLAMPVLTLAGSESTGASMLANITPLAIHVRGVLLKGCGHFIPEECPDDYVDAVLEFWGEAPAKGR